MSLFPMHEGGRDIPMRTIEGPLCETCGDGIERVDPKTATGDGRWTHINVPNDHMIIVRYRVIKKR